MKSTLLPFLKQAMKLSTMIGFALIATTGLLIAKKVTAQYLEKRIVMHLNGEDAWEVIQQMERQDIRFAYNAETLGLADIKVTNHQARIESSVKELLDQLFAKSDVVYREANGFIMLQKKQQEDRKSTRLNSSH